MKAEIISPKTQKEFTPITVQITLETIQEARALFHVANNSGSALLAFSDYKVGSPYSHNISAGISGNLHNLIIKEVERQGFKI